LGAIAWGVWGRKSPSEVQGEAVVGVPQKVKPFADIVYRF